MYISHLGMWVRCIYMSGRYTESLPGNSKGFGHDLNGRLNRKDDITLVEIYFFSGHILD